MRFFGRNKKSKTYICPECKKEWNEKDLGFKQKRARKLVLSGSTLNIGFITVSNPFFATRPDKAEEYCLKCLREYMGLDSLNMNMNLFKK